MLCGLRRDLSNRSFLVASLARILRPEA
jgi:hypothetical protein